MQQKNKLTSLKHISFEMPNVYFLFQKYQINTTSHNKWEDLALALARDKVKGFSTTILETKKAGRPSKPNKSKKKSIGRPKSWLPLDTWIRWVEEIKFEHGLNGRGSDKAAITILVNALPREYVKGSRQSEIKYFQKKLATARARLIPKKSKN